MLTKMKKNSLKLKKKSKLKKKKKPGKMIWWIGTFPQILALIHLMVSEKTRFTDDGRTTDAPRH